MRGKIIFLSLSLVFWGCDDDGSSSQTNLDGGQLYIALQGMDEQMNEQVAIIDADDLALIELIDINFSDTPGQMEMPHYIIFDEFNEYWFLTTMGASSIGMFSSNTNEMIGAPLTLADSPALFEIDVATKTLYV